VSGDLDGVAFNGPVEMGQVISKSDKAGSCLVRNLYRYANGVLEADGQEFTLAQLTKQFEDNKRDFHQLMLDVVTSDGFRLVAPAL